MDRISLNSESLTLTLGERSSHLTRKTADVLLALEEAKGEPLGRDHLMRRVWRETVVEDAALKQHVYMLRGVFRELDPDRDYIVTVPNRGYRLAVPIDVKRIAVPEHAISVEAPTPQAIPASTRRWRLLFVPLVALFLVWASWHAYRKWRASQLLAQGFQELRIRRSYDLTTAANHFQAAAQLDPSLAEAYGGLAQVMARHNKTVPGHALDMAERALKLDPACGLCLSTRGWILLTREWKWKGAASDFELGVSPRSAIP